MSTKNSVVALLILQTAILLQLPNSVYSAATPQQCGTQQCRPRSDCHYVATCPTCNIGQPQCVSQKKVGPDIDRECLSAGYTDVILIEDPNNAGYLNRLKCSGPDFQADCPDGSVCVSDGHGRGVCCKGERPQQAAFVQTEKSGSCPSNIPCSGTYCEEDSHCPGRQKCCNGCVNVCTEPV